MKAMAQQSWRAGEPLTMIELPTPAVRSNEMRVAVKAVGVNPVDWKMRQRGPLRLAARVVGPPPPVVVGVDFAGVVEEVGSGVANVKVGDHVVGGTNFSRGQRGSYADTVVVRPDQVCVLPPGFDLDVAATLPVAGVTAWMSVVEQGRITAGKRVLVLGASGGVGQFCVQVARHVCDAYVVGVCSTRNVDLVTGLGANQVLDYTAGDALAQAKALDKFDVVIDCAGGYSGSACRSLLAPGGRHVIVAGDTPAAAVQFLVPPFRSKNILAMATTARLQHLVDAIAAGKIQVSIAQRLPLAEAEEAHRLSETGRMTGKMVLNP